VPIESQELIDSRARAIVKLQDDVAQLGECIAMLRVRGCSQRTMTDLLRMESDWLIQLSIMRDHQAAVE
jgi:hypothetical protein